IFFHTYLLCQPTLHSGKDVIRDSHHSAPRCLINFRVQAFPMNFTVPHNMMITSNCSSKQNLLTMPRKYGGTFVCIRFSIPLSSVSAIYPCALKRPLRLQPSCRLSLPNFIG